MGKYNKFDIEKVKEADIRLFIPGAKAHKGSQELECPFCGAKCFSVVHGKGKNFAYCHKCEKGFSDPVAAMMHYGKLEWLDAVEAVARQGGIVLTPESERREHAIAGARSESTSSFCAAQLKGSGLKVEDLMASVVVDKTPTYLCPFRKGTFDVYNNFKVDPSGDDMLIYYYDLTGVPMTYVAKGTSTARPYVRVRWSNPSIHQSSDGKEIKYQTPPNAPSRCYIPERIRKLYQAKEHIDTLFIQEGEKKAEKACLHGIPSIGIQGIGNFGSAREGLLEDIQRIAKVCSVGNVVLLMDSDWNNLHRTITVGDAVDKRPNAFAKTVIKFKTFLGTLHNIGLSVNIWWGHVNENPAGDKGIDDLLAHTLAGREDDLRVDIDKAMHAHDGHGEWCDLHNISTMSDAKIQDYWMLNDPKTFFAAHKAQLAAIPTFKIGRIRYKVEEDELVPVSRYSSDSDIYSIEKDAKENDKVVFNYLETMNFLRDNGFRRVCTSEDPGGGYQFVRLDEGILSIVASWEIRNFVLEYVLTNCKYRIVTEFFYAKLPSILADKYLEQLPLLDDLGAPFMRGVQHTPYNNGTVEITANSIVPGKPFGTVWRRQIVARAFTRVPIIKSITKTESGFQLEYSEEAKQCEFLQYLMNTSNNAFTSENRRDFTPDELKDFTLHLVNKITSIGFLLSDYKYSTERKTVVIQDHQISEVGVSKGGSGKSLIGMAIGKVKCQAVIDGKNIDAKFPLYNVTKETRTVFIDDVRVNFDYESLFNMATGMMSINRKNRDPLDLPAEVSPKIFISTNHAINGAQNGSIRRRILYMEASAWYNENHTPIMDFGHEFFDDWDPVQWNLFDNLMAECTMYYFRSVELGWSSPGCGVVTPPMVTIEMRTLRQSMSEALYQWAEEYFDPTGPFLNVRCRRKDVLNAFYEFAGMDGHGVKRTNFKNKLVDFCRYKGWDFNVNQPNAEGICYNDWKLRHPDDTFVGSRDVSGGEEYFTVYSPEKEAEFKPF